MPRIKINPFRAHKREDVKRLEESQRKWVYGKHAWGRPDQDNHDLESETPNLVFYETQTASQGGVEVRFTTPPDGKWRCCYEPAGGPAMITDTHISFNRTLVGDDYRGHMAGRGEDANGLYELSGRFLRGRFAWSEKHPHLYEHHMECSAVCVLDCDRAPVLLRGAFRTNRGARGTVVAALVAVDRPEHFSFPPQSPATGKQMEEHVVRMGQFDFAKQRLPDLQNGNRWKQPDATMILLMCPPPPVMKRPVGALEAASSTPDSLKYGGGGGEDPLLAPVERDSSAGEVGPGVEGPHATPQRRRSDPRSPFSSFPGGAGGAGGAASPRAPGASSGSPLEAALHRPMLWMREHPADGCEAPQKVFMPLHALQQKLKGKLMSKKMRRQLKLEKNAMRGVADRRDLYLDYHTIWQEQMRSLIALNAGLPAGWECMRCPASGVPYYTNHNMPPAHVDSATWIRPTRTTRYNPPASNGTHHTSSSPPAPSAPPPPVQPPPPDSPDATPDMGHPQAHESEDHADGSVDGLKQAVSERGDAQSFQSPDDPSAQGASPAAHLEPSPPSKPAGSGGARGGHTRAANRAEEANGHREQPSIVTDFADL